MRTDHTGGFQRDRRPRKVSDATLRAGGGIDVLGSNAAVQIAEPWTDVSRDQFDTQVAVTLRSKASTGTQRILAKPR